MPSPDQRPPHLPEELWTKERELIHARRASVPDPDGKGPPGVVGLALSGGGIRSATLSLGVLQGLARLGLLRFVDFVSTVSGGGYMGTCLGGLYQRWEARADAPRQEDWARVEAALQDQKRHPIDWLRENGRYLAPNGASDLSYAVAVVLRNLVAIHVVLATSFLALFLALNGLRIGGVELAGRLSGGPAAWLEGLARSSFWWSPLLVLPAACFVALAFPLGLAYWLAPSEEEGGRATWWRGGTGEPKDREERKAQVAALLAIVLFLAAGLAGLAAALLWRPLVAAGLAPAPAIEGGPMGPPGWLLPSSLALAAVTGLALLFHARWGRRDHEARNQLTLRLRTALVATAALLLLALVDSLGQTLYVLWQSRDLLPWFAGLLSALAGGAVVLQRLSGLLGKGGAARPRVPVVLVASVAAALLVTALLAGTSAVAHRLTWRADRTTGTPDPPAVSLVATSRAGERRDVAATSDQTLHRCGAPEARHLCVPHQLDRWTYLVALGLSVALTFLFGWTFPFVNRSSLAALYGGQLARAYLGASNPERAKVANKVPSVQVEGDDLPLARYRPHEHGGPLHLINVTVNETVGGRSQVEQRDRKGMGMAIGPAGVSVGVQHHAAWTEGELARPGELTPTAEPRSGFRVFPPVKPDGELTDRILPRWPTVGRWMAISGAAVSPGLGSRTSLALSLLIGLTNVRLGHWWHSDIAPSRRLETSRPPSSLVRAAGLLARALPVQAHLLSELLARFPGTSSEHWYLTDGGHFENSGAYELIRRRLPTVIVCDHGADPERSFADLAELVRKVRIDFGARIEFLSQEELEAVLCDERERARRVIGTLADLGFRGAQPPQAAPPGGPPQRRYAALARVVHEGGASPTVLLWLRPGLLHGEPADVLGYGVTHQAFPQESTADQFFDEAQWESYRRLGEQLAATVFAELKPLHGAPDPADGWKLVDPDKLAG